MEQFASDRVGSWPRSIWLVWSHDVPIILSELCGLRVWADETDITLSISAFHKRAAFPSRSASLPRLIEDWGCGQVPGPALPGQRLHRLPEQARQRILPPPRQLHPGSSRPLRARPQSHQPVPAPVHLRPSAHLDREVVHGLRGLFTSLVLAFGLAALALLAEWLIRSLASSARPQLRLNRQLPRPPAAEPISDS